MHVREPLVTQRLVLRDIAEADGDLLFELDSDPQVMRYLGPRPADDAAWYRDRIRNVLVPQLVHAWHGVRIVLERISGDFLGWAFIRPATFSVDALVLGWTRPEEAEIGYRFRQCAWGAAWRPRRPRGCWDRRWQTRRRRRLSRARGRTTWRRCAFWKSLASPATAR
jgi:RimJ/RimL family protein N-acetyltransferase